MRSLLTSIFASIVFIVSTTSAPSLGAIDLNFDVDFPSFTGVDATIMINDQPCLIEIRIAPDAKGKYG